MNLSEIAIQVRGVGKKYRIGASTERYYTLRDQLSRVLSAPFRMFGGREKSKPKSEEFWALKDISFDINKGEVVGIIGRNGAGKSTLLKILSRITEPTEGEIDLFGRVGSLLEVGTGFHPELTGRENIYLNGAILGMKRAEIIRKFDEIVAFAEVEKFIDTPVKFYSSGMYMRLAFAVAAHLEPEILIVDEVLAVGDAEFQKKCLGKMGQVARGGRTVLFVSHHMPSVVSLCERVVWLRNGQILEIGTCRAVVERYASEGIAVSERELDLSKTVRSEGMGEVVSFTSLEWVTPLPLVLQQDVVLRLRLRAIGRAEDISIGVGFNLPDGSRFLTFNSDTVLTRESVSGPTERVYELSIPGFPVSPGRYDLDLGIRSGDRSMLDYLSRFVQVEVVSAANSFAPLLHNQNHGVLLPGQWSRVS